MPASTVATLNLDYMFTAVAGTTYTYQLLGETMATTTAVDHVVNIELPATQLSKVLCYGSNWYLQTGSTGVGETGAAGTYYQPAPSVALLLTTVLGSVLDELSSGLTGVTTGSYASDAANYITDDSSAAVPNLVRKFQDIKGFTYLNNGSNDGATGTVVDYLADIPVEAIQSVSFSTVDTLPLSVVTGDLVSTYAAGETMAHSGLSGALESLFEQAVSAGMVTAGNTGGPDLSTTDVWATVPQAVQTLEDAMNGDSSEDLKVYGATFAPGQSLGIFVKYNLQKVRQYQLAANPSTSYSTPEGRIWCLSEVAGTPNGGEFKVSGKTLSISKTDVGVFDTSSFFSELALAISKAGSSGLEVNFGNGLVKLTLVGGDLSGDLNTYVFTASLPISGFVTGINYSISYSTTGPLGGAIPTELVFGGETFTATLGEAAEVSEVVPVVYQIVFTATSATQ